MAHRVFMSSSVFVSLSGGGRPRWRWSPATDDGRLDRYIYSNRTERKRCLVDCTGVVVTAVLPTHRRRHNSEPTWTPDGLTDDTRTDIVNVSQSCPCPRWSSRSLNRPAYSCCSTICIRIELLWAAANDTNRPNWVTSIGDGETVISVAWQQYTSRTCTTQGRWAAV